VLFVLFGLLAGPNALGPEADSETRRVSMRLPPHLRDRDDGNDYPLPMPVAALRRLAGGDEQAVEAMVDCLTDGPPQHALANAAMLCLIDALLRKA
jgi:hypothetical protein